jgi:hypothetical protein
MALRAESYVQKCPDKSGVLVKEMVGIWLQSMFMGLRTTVLLISNTVCRLMTQGTSYCDG